MIVVDASALTDFLLGRPPAFAAFASAMAGREQEPLHAPELIELETLNALRHLSLGGELAEQRATEAVSDLAAVRIVRYPHAPFRERVWELRHELSSYDAAYLALAEALDEPLLLTGDAGLAARARRSLGAGGVRQLR